MKVLITGGAGFIGTHLTHALLERDHEVSIIDRRLKPEDDLLYGGLFAGDVEQVRPDAVIHLAAQVGRLFGEDDVRNSVRSNAEMTATVATACARYGVRLLYASTSEVYGDQGDALCEEDGPMVLPHNIYGLSKRWGEEVIRLYLPPEQRLMMRFSMPYGTGVPPGRGRAALPNVLWQAHTRQSIPIHRGAERSWCWIGDTVSAVVMLLERGQSGAWNIGRDDDARPMREIAERACKMTGADPELIEDVDPPRAQTVVKRLSTEKLRELGWFPMVEIDEGMKRVLEWVKGFDASGKRLPGERAA